MNRARRCFLWAVAVAPAFAWSACAWAQQPQPHSQRWPRLPEPVPENPHPGDLSRTQQRTILKDNQKKMRKDVERLFKLASELRDEVARTDSSKILSLDLISRAEEIEKLAKQIKNLARG